MILVDTNVISEPLRKSPDSRVVEWLDGQPMETLFLSAITVAELRFGVASLPAGRRRDGLRQSLEQKILPLFAGRVLPFDLLASQSYAVLMAKARAAGVAIAASDGYIAATAHASGMRVATRDTAPFEAAGVPTFDPWRD
jgi:toxin FitB